MRPISLFVAGLSFALALACSGNSTQESSDQPAVERLLVEPWELTFEQAGGIAGLRRSAIIDSAGNALFRDLRSDQEIAATLMLPELRQLGELIDASNWLSQREDQRTPGCRDCIAYTLNLKLGGESRRVRADDQGLSEKLRPLVEWLTERTLRATQSR